ncbi:MAG: pantetheine-phosphate adenylyltransferase [Clostridia bacterium]|nr:pantetheine-phosphate adenylyltransferase [Clostridia bacterium]
MNDEKKKRIAILPGSYDPMTLGHLNILQRSAKLYDQVYLALMINSDKKYTFDLETRIEIAELSCVGIPNVKVIYDGGMLADLAKRLGCSAIIKGVRNSADFEYEKKMAEFNRRLAPDVETLLMPCDDKMGEISSTAVRELFESGRADQAEKLLAKGVADIIRKTEVYK